MSDLRRWASRLPAWLPALAVAAGVIVLYLPVLGHRFLLNWDDLAYVIDNPATRGLSWSHLREAFSRTYVGNYAPLHIASYMLDHELWGLRAGGYALDNALIHAANGAALYLLLWRMLGRWRVALLAALVFAFHPVQVESVAWISQRKTVLCALLVLASLHLYLSYREGRRSTWSYSASLATFGLALLVKAVAVVLPVVLLLLDLTHPRRRGSRGLVWDKIPFAMVAGGGAVLAILSQQPEASSGRTAYLGGDPMATVFTMATVQAQYLRLLLFPAGLSAAYDVPIRIALDVVVVSSLALVALLVALGVFLARRRPRLFFWYGVFFVGLAPVSQLVPIVTLMNDRYLYVPMLGAGPLAALTLVPPDPGRAPRWRRGLAGAFCGAVLLLPWLSAQRLPAWRDDVALWTDASLRAPDSADVWFSLGTSLQDAGRLDDAGIAYLSALTVDLDYSFALHNLRSVGIARSRAVLEARLRRDPTSARDLVLLGTTQLLLGDYSGAVWAYDRAAAIRPTYAALFGLGNAHLRAGALDQSRAALTRAAIAAPHDPRLAYTRARVEALSGRTGAALRLLGEALRRGYKDRQLVEQDPALASVRATAEYARLRQRFLPPRRVPE